MNNDIDQFDVLEKKIGQLVESYSTLQGQKAAISEQLIQKDTEIKNLRDRVAQLSREREIAREKVEGLLSRVEHLISPKAGIGKG